MFDVYWHYSSWLVFWNEKQYIIIQWDRTFWRYFRLHNRDVARMVEPLDVVVSIESKVHGSVYMANVGNCSLFSTSYEGFADLILEEVSTNPYTITYTYAKVTEPPVGRGYRRFSQNP